ncbi:hypothetical protein ACHAWF_014679 [Thalassiosira exigua]
MPANYKYARGTVDSTLFSAVHDRRRREERGIEKVDLQRARRYGMKEPAKKGREKYTYGGVVFIYDPKTKTAVTSYPSKDSSNKSGTKLTTPIMLAKHEFNCVAERMDQQRHHENMARVLSATPTMRAQWRSHSVLVVDMSGSMRNDDVNGARCRSDGVWMALARDYVKDQLKKGLRNKHDLVTIIVMKEYAEVTVRCEPTTWVLYNKLIDMREWSRLRPEGPGNYLPAIDKAEELLTSNTNSGCALSLLFFSDGKPSDPGDDRPVIVDKIGKLASKFGRRLSIACIGMAEESEDFSTLNDMVTEAKQYGAQATFGKPTLDADSLSNIITSLASSLTTSKTEMTELQTGKAKLLRMDIEREKMNTPDDVGTWKKYTSDGSLLLNGYWAWKSFRNTFVKIVDKRCAFCWTEDLLIVCPGCKAYFICANCHGYGQALEFKAHRKRNNRQSECDKYLAVMRMGNAIEKDIPSFSIAVKDQIFGEGAERIVRKVRFLDADGNYVGPTMVAKESRFIESHGGTYEEQMNYHREFMRTQDIASDLAQKFNRSILQVLKHFRREDQQHLSRKLPRIEFIEPMVVELTDGGAEKNVLIEQYLDGDYKKFNSNMGYVDEEVKKFERLRHDQQVKNVVGKMNDLGLRGNYLGAIEEDSEEEDENSSEEEIFDSTEASPHQGTYNDLQDAYIPQTFSHYTYQRSKGQLMVVDLQGVFKVRSDGTKVYKLTDPVIHKHRRNRNRVMKKWSFGRTDRGEKGMRAFFETHKCTDACKLLGLTEVDADDIVC